MFLLPEYKKMIAPDFKVLGDTLYVPLLYCEPNSFTISNVTFTAPSDGDALKEMGDCVSKDILILATSGTLIITIFALIIFMIVDCASRRDCCKRSLAIGMGLFLIFILLQSGLEASAVAYEGRFWESIYQKIRDSIVSEDETLSHKVFTDDNGALTRLFSVTNVQTHGSWKLSAAVSIFSFILSFLILIDQIVCFVSTKTTATTPSSVSEPTFKVEDNVTETDEDGMDGEANEKSSPHWLSIA